MKALKLAVFAVAAASLLAGCCCPYKAKAYPYPVYDYSPARVCSCGCPPSAAAPCAAAPCAVTAPIAGQACATCR